MGWNMQHSVWYTGECMIADIRSTAFSVDVRVRPKSKETKQGILNTRNNETSKNNIER